MHTLHIVVTLATALILLLSCGYTSEPRDIQCREERVTLRWDPPPFSGSDVLSPIGSYALFYRRSGDPGWKFIGTVAASDSPKYTLHHRDFGNGIYDFAVIAVNAEGVTSVMHTSRDVDADPIGGWTLVWVR